MSFFMATDPVSSPMSKQGKVIFGVGIGVLVVVIRLLGSYSEGVIFSLLFMNMMTPLINNKTEGKYRFGYKSFIVGILVATLVSGISIFASSKLERLSVEEIDELYNKSIGAYKGRTRIIEMTNDEDEDIFTYIIDSDGFKSTVRVKIVIDRSNELIKSVEVLSTKDTYGIGTIVKTNEEFLNQFKDMPLNLDTEVDSISGVTYSSNGVFKAVRRAMEETLNE